MQIEQHWVIPQTAPYSAQRNWKQQNLKNGKVRFRLNNNVEKEMEDSRLDAIECLKLPSRSEKIQIRGSTTRLGEKANQSRVFQFLIDGLSRSAYIYRFAPCLRAQHIIAWQRRQQAIFGYLLPLSKRVLAHNPLYMEMRSRKSNSFPYERLRSRTRFETEAKETRKWLILYSTTCQVGRYVGHVTGGIWSHLLRSQCQNVSAWFLV